MEKLRAEKEQYIAWKLGEQQILSLNRKIRAYEYYQRQHIMSLKMEENSDLDYKMEALQIEFEKNKRFLEN